MCNEYETKYFFKEIFMPSSKKYGQKHERSCGNLDGGIFAPALDVAR